VVTNFTERIRGLGPLGTAEGRDFSELEFKLRAAQATARSEKLRWVAAKQTEFMTEGNRYGEVFTRHELNRMLEGVIADEMAVNEILLIMKERPSSVKEMAAAIDMPPPRVLRYVSALRKKGLIDLHSLDGNSPLYALRVEEEAQQ
jgi:DNA-binding transcriptional ArsR family regulator